MRTNTPENGATDEKTISCMMDELRTMGDRLMDQTEMIVKDEEEWLPCSSTSFLPREIVSLD